MSDISLDEHFRLILIKIKCRVVSISSTHCFFDRKKTNIITLSRVDNGSMKKCFAFGIISSFLTIVDLK